MESISSTSIVVTKNSGEPELVMPANWRGLRMSRCVIPDSLETGPACVSTPMLILATSGRGRRWYRFGTKTIELSTAPDMFELYSSDFQREGACWQGRTGQSVSVFLDPLDVRRLVPESDGFDVRTIHELFDPKLSWLVQELTDEAQRGAPSGAIYVEGLSASLIGRLAELYGAPKSARPAPGQLYSTSQKKVLDFIEAHLGDDFGVTEMAHEAGLSPHHFSRCFKNTLGLTPHQYVLQRRMEVALKLLNETILPVSEIALTVGFSNQSHFTQAFKRHTGTTPATSRKP